VLDLDPAKLFVIAVVAILLLGPNRLPEVARQVGAAWRMISDFRHRMETEVRKAVPDLPPSSDISRLARSPTALLDHLSKMTNADGESPIERESPIAGESPITELEPALPPTKRVVSDPTLN
jgi:Sec-independent protein translocase protein TatA